MDRYEAKYGKDPEFVVAGSWYDAILLIAKAMEQGGFTSGQLISPRDFDKRQPLFHNTEPNLPRGLVCKPNLVRGGNS